MDADSRGRVAGHRLADSRPNLHRGRRFEVNIGESATSSVASSAFHLSLAPVGALHAVAGDVLGAYYGLLRLDLL